MYLSIDLGSTSFKAGVFDGSLRERGRSAYRVAYDFTPGGGVEFDVEAALEGLGRAVRGALEAAGARGEDLAAVALTSQAQTFTVLGPDGRAKVPFISWQDGRGKEAAAALARMSAFAAFGEHSSFGSLLPALQVCLVKYLREARPGLFAPEDLVLKLPGLVVRDLTGAAYLDENLAAMSGLYSLVERDWWGPALAACGLSRSQLPEVVPVGSVASRTVGAAPLGLPAGIPVVLAGNDQTAGAYGAAVHERDAVLVTLGTAQVAYACADRLPPPLEPCGSFGDSRPTPADPLHGGPGGAPSSAPPSPRLRAGSVALAKEVAKATEGSALRSSKGAKEGALAPYGLARGVYPGGRFYRMAADICGGNCVTWASGAIEGCSGEPGLFGLAREAPAGSNGLVFRPTRSVGPQSGANAPGPSEAAGSGEWEGASPRTTPADRARSVLEALARRMAEMVGMLGVDAAAKTILVAGGGSRERVWVDILEDALGADLTPVEADPLLGAAGMAREAVEPKRSTNGFQQGWTGFTG